MRLTTCLWAAPSTLTLFLKIKLCNHYFTKSLIHFSELHILLPINVFILILTLLKSYLLWEGRHVPPHHLQEQRTHVAMADTNLHWLILGHPLHKFVLEYWNQILNIDQCMNLNHCSSINCYCNDVQMKNIW